MKIIVSVFNNLYIDQRVEKVCQTLHEAGYEILLIGNDWDGSPPMQRPYAFQRIALKSKMLRFAYLEFNQKLYRELLKHADEKTILLANDLDTILPNYLVAKKRNIPLVFDSHEIFAEMPSVQGRWTQKIWRWVERKTLPQLKYMYTANESYAQWFAKKHNIQKPLVVRNFPKKTKVKNIEKNTTKIVLYQGVLNPSRGLDKVIPAMNEVEAELWIVGDGPEKKNLVDLTKRLRLENKIKFLGKYAPDKLRNITPKADVGLSIEENKGWSYYYSLPNKVADYIQSRVPLVMIDFPEMKRIYNEFKVGEILTNHEPKNIAEKINIVLENGRDFYLPELEKAAEKLCWENEENKIRALYEKVVQENF